MEKITVEAKNVGERIDRFLAREFFLYSRAEIVRKIKNGEVLVDNKKVKPSYVLENDNAIMLENFSREVEDNTLKGDANIPLDVIFENEDMVVINKQAGLQVHPSFHTKQKTLVNALLAKFPEIIEVHDESVGAEFRPGIVHRLDKDTSGVMIIARNKNAFNALKENFKNRKIEKKYLAVTNGILKNKEGVIDKPLAKSSTYRKQVIARANTKTTVRGAETFFKVIGEFGDVSLIEVAPKTGRTHQIRIHLASIGHPIVGDLVYAKKTQKKAELTQKHVISRQLLHAKELKFELFGQKYDFIAPLPQDFTNFLDLVRKKTT